MNKFNLRCALVFLMAAVAMPVYPSGGGIGGFGGGGAGSPAPTPRVRDETYELGKSLVKGRVPGVEKIEYCVKVDGELKKLKRATVKTYKKAAVKDFALALFDCADPERHALTTLEKEHVGIVLYYLNKRFKLDLQDA